MFDVDDLVSECRAALGEPQPASAVEEILERALSHPAQIDDALGTPTKGGLVPLHHSAELTILQIVWPPRASLFPHDHRMWAANGIYGGREDNTFYRRAAGGIVRAGGASLDAGQVTLLDADAIHSVVNPHRGFTAAIHVYGGDFFATPRSEWDARSRERPFDIEHLERVLAAPAAPARSGRDGREHR